MSSSAPDSASPKSVSSESAAPAHTGPSTAGILIIGNEILTAKVQDENAPYLLQGLRELGIQVRRVHVIPDVIEEIAEEVARFSRAYRYVFTSGGVGPTHDDVTMDGISAAFGCKLVLHPEMEQTLRKALRGVEPNKSQLKMCTLPEGAELLHSDDLWFPLVKVSNVYVFPGIPRLLQAKFEALRDRLEGRPVHVRRVFVNSMESDIAELLNELISQFADLEVGSYPATQRVDYRTLVTIEASDEQLVTRAVDVLVGKLPRNVLLRVE